MAVYFWAGWLIWAILLRLSGMRHPAVPPYPALSRGRQRLATLALVMLVLTFAPSPILHGSLFEVLQQQWHGIR